MTEATKPDTAAMSAEDQSKDEFFVKLADVAQAMVAAHGKDFAMGALVLSARFIAEGRPLIKPSGKMSDWMNAASEMKSEDRSATMQAFRQANGPKRA